MREGYLVASSSPQPLPLPPLTPFVRGLLLDEVADQCKFAIFATLDLNAALAKQDFDRCWFSIQNVLTSVANVSKILWGNFAEPHVEQRKVLRDPLAVGDASPLKIREVRNDSEHIASRIIERLGDDTHRKYLGRNIGPKSAVQIGAVAEDWFHHFDPATNEVTFWNHAISLQAVMDEIVRIRPLATAASDAADAELRL
jgi:hypothetical protein